jgi:hypothetical protein
LLVLDAGGVSRLAERSRTADLDDLKALADRAVRVNVERV